MARIDYFPFGNAREEQGGWGRDEAGKIVLFSALATSLILPLLMILVSLVSGRLSTLMDAILMSVFLIIVWTGGFVVSFFLINWISYQASKLLGGKGEYGVQSYLLALAYTLLLPMLLIFMYLIPNLLPPGASLLGSVVIIVVNIYCLYLCAVVVKVAHGFGIIKALCAYLPIILFTILLSVLAGGR